ncbi:acyltransferase family protein [Mesoflavibacter zeaxanthinifaciens]|uniref:acyltransferase family protein n=1 Tax=Mesoflavibacter zeaxanthinifaciens TaxID=393060 RepID=UPI003A915015
MKLDYIDGLRGIAILLVVLTHTFQYSTFYDETVFSYVIAQGARGVQLFFIVSAFTLFLSFNSRREKKELNIYKNFFIRRFFRIAPLYYLGIIYFLLQDGLGKRYWLGDVDHISFLNILSNIFFFNDFNPYWITSVVPGGWSIGVEMTFYVFIPFLVLKVTSLNKALIFTITSLIISIILNDYFSNNVLISSDRLWKEYLFFYFPNQLPVFGVGIILYYIIIKKETLSKITLYISLLLIVGIVCFFKSQIHSNIPFALIFFILIYILSKKHLKLFVNKLTIFLGKISYSAYLIHFAILHWLSSWNMLNVITVDSFYTYVFNFTFNLIMVLFLTALLSNLSHKYLELNFINYGRMLIKKLQ